MVYLSATAILIVILIPLHLSPNFWISAMTFLALIFSLPIIGAMMEAGPGSPPKTLTYTMRKKVMNVMVKGICYVPTYSSAIVY